ncbi:MAG TPA: Sir2 family NAD-dependent protein deacetylase [Vicinamibacteria bacterium]
MPNPETLALDDDTSVLVLTGAGVSAESGIPTFRAAGGFWESHSIEQVASPGGFARDPALVWRFYSERRQKALTCLPNPGHHALRALEERLGDRFLLATQNVDDLHRRAGSQRLVEIHGNLFLTRCSHCAATPVRDEEEHFGPDLPRCPACARGGRESLLRPHIVWFGEMLDPRHLERIDRFMDAARRLVFLAAGTSGAVWPAAGMVNAARARGATTWLVNAEAAENTAAFHHFVEGPSGLVLPALLKTA